MCCAAVRVYVIGVSHPREAQGAPRVKALLSFSICSGLAAMGGWKMLLPWGRRVHHQVQHGGPQVAGESHVVETSFLFAVDLVEETLAHVDGGTFFVSHVISQKYPTWLRRLNP